MRGTGGEMYNTLEGWDYGDDYTHNSGDGGAISALQEDVESVLGIQAVVKSMLDDVIGGQHAKTEQLSSILRSGVLTLNKSMEPSLTTLSTTTPQRDSDMGTLEGLVEELQRNSTHGTTSPSSNNSLTLSPHRPHSLIHLNTDRDLQTNFLAKRRGFGLLAELRGVRMERCQ